MKHIPLLDSDDRGHGMLVTSPPIKIARAGPLLRVTAAIANAVTRDEVFEALVDHVAVAVDASSAGLWLVADDGVAVGLARCRGYAEESRRKLEHLSLADQPSLPVLDSIRQGEPIWIPSQAAMLERYPHLATYATTARNYRISCLPLIAGDRVLGALGLTIEEAGEADEEERDFLRLVATYASQALERLRLLEAERRSRAEADAAAIRLGVLSRASRVFGETDLDLHARLRSVAGEIGALFSSAVSITLVRGDDTLDVATFSHPDPEAEPALRAVVADHPLRLGDGVSGVVVASGKSELVPMLDPAHVAARVPEPYREFIRRFPAYATICAPLRAQGRVIGAVAANRTRPGETYTNEDLRLLEDLSERAAVAIENSRLFEETRAARTRAEQLYRFAQSVVAADRVEVIFEAAIEAIEGALGARRSAVLIEDEAGVMRFRAWRRLSDTYRAAVEGHSPWPRDIVDPQPVLVPYPESDPAMASFLPLLRSEGIGALAFIPIVSGGRLLGKFMVYYEHPHPFAPHELDTARAIANHLGSVITRFHAVGRLEETIRFNELFAGALAHDLRNPLSAIMTAARVVLMQREGEGAPDEREARPLGRILSSGERMANMIDQLLDFTRARSGGGIDLSPDETNLVDLCVQAIGELEITHPEWEIRREVRGDVSGTWDRDRLLQVISNLVANAGQHGESAAGIGVVLDGRQSERVRIEVHNQGVIPDSLLPHLFDPFRGARYRRDQARGLGLGLFIVREIVRAHGGTVGVTTSAAAGTTFAVDLPRHASRPRRPADFRPVEGSQF